MSCDFGQFDIAGFPKPHAYWYAANWLQAVPEDDPSRPPLPATPVVRLLDLPSATGWAADRPGPHPSLEVAGLASSPYVQLVLDGHPQPAKPSARDSFGAFTSTSWPVPMPPPPPCGGPAASNFPLNASGVQCHGLIKVPEVAAAEACAAACCAAAGCNTWQYDLGAPSKGCWVGFASPGGCGTPGQLAVWVGGQRHAPAFTNATLVALDSPAGEPLATHTLLIASANASSYRLALTLDVPSSTTGTGNALLLDGRDTALVRAAVVSGPIGGSGALVASATHRISWRLVSGPGRLVGVSNGDPMSHEWMKSTSVSAFGGLARGFVRVSQDCASVGRELAGAIDFDGARSPTRVLPDVGTCDTSPIVVAASADGLGEAQLSIAVSTDAAADGVFAVAAREGASSSFSYLNSFVG